MTTNVKAYRLDLAAQHSPKIKQASLIGKMWDGYKAVWLFLYPNRYRVQSKMVKVWSL